jgi:hypothetical protein
VQQYVDEVTPGFEWVLSGGGTATEKVDGIGVAVIDGKAYFRMNAWMAKRDKFRSGNYAPGEIIELGGAEKGTYVLAKGDGFYAQKVLKAQRNTPWVRDGRFEMVGTEIKHNPYDLDAVFLEKHGRIRISDIPRTFCGLRDWFATHEVEGVIFSLSDQAFCKVERIYFGYPWPAPFTRRFKEGRGDGDGNG